jgi:hypothetical protein
MRVIADAAQEAGGKIVGVSVEPIAFRARPNADEMDREGFFPRALSEYLFFSKTPQRAMQYIGNAIEIRRIGHASAECRASARRQREHVHHPLHRGDIENPEYFPSMMVWINFVADEVQVRHCQRPLN